MIKKAYHRFRRLLRMTGRDIFRMDTLESLTKELELQKRNHETWKLEHQRPLPPPPPPPPPPESNDRIEALTRDLEFQWRYHEAHRLERSIIPLRPERFSYIKNVNNDELLIFKAETSEDFDWLEQAIFKFGYYEKPNIWSFTVDEDKRVLAQMLRTFNPRRTLDFGCANGAVVQALADLGINSEGVEISSYALAHAFPGIKSRIHHGDILELQLVPASYDVVSGFDIFEHLNPNKIDACISKVRELVAPGGFVFANIPAFGKDEVFGEVFPYYMPDWDNQRNGESYFKSLHTDMHGYPVNGHLIWADTKWWAGLFERHGFVRRLDKERELHSQYELRLVESRKSFYVFQKP